MITNSKHLKYQASEKCIQITNMEQIIGEHNTGKKKGAEIERINKITHIAYDYTLKHAETYDI